MGLARFLSSRGCSVVEVNRPDRSALRRKRKGDSANEEMTAGAVLAGVAHATPKTGTDQVEMIRMLKVTTYSTVKACAQTMNQMRALIGAAPADLR